MQGLPTLLTVGLVWFAACSGQSCDREAERACTKHLAPVCATFRKTFDNQCEMNRQLCQLAKDGFHFAGESNAGDCCHGVCTSDFSPVCGSDGHVYPNMCSLVHARCANRDYITEASPGDCAEPPLVSRK